MATLKCKCCGSITTTRASKWTEPFKKGDKAECCYAAFKNGVWVKGCAYKKLVLENDKNKIDNIILSGKPPF